MHVTSSIRWAKLEYHTSQIADVSADRKEMFNTPMTIHCSRHVTHLQCVFLNCFFNRSRIRCLLPENVNNIDISIGNATPECELTDF